MYFNLKSLYIGAATTTTTVSDDEVTTRVKGYIDAGTCGTISFGEFDTSVCGDAASSYYKEFTYNGKRVIISNNVSMILGPFLVLSDSASSSKFHHWLLLACSCHQPDSAAFELLSPKNGPWYDMITVIYMRDVTLDS